MSSSIFHVRPLDSGKGWAIDEYDGRGAWQHSVPIGPDGAPMDKIQAQRAVFQLRRKAVNSAKPKPAVNKYCAHREALGSGFCPDCEQFVNLLPPIEPDWENLEHEVVERIRALAAMMGDKCDAPAALKAKIYADLVRPNFRLLADFCANVAFSDADEDARGGNAKDITGCDV